MARIFDSMRSTPWAHAAISHNSAVGPNSCEEIRATHLLEHFSHLKTVEILNDWFRALKSGGRIYIEVPHIFGHVAALNAGEITHEQFIVYVYGDQDYEGNAHYAGFDRKILEKKMRQAGFMHVTTNDIGMVIIAEGRKP